MANRTCIACNSKYSYCPNCGSGRLAPYWKATFCSETCKELWDILTRHSMNLLTKSEAAEKIKSLELKDKSEYVACVQRDMEKKFFFKKKEPKARKTKKVAVEEVQPAESEINADTHEVVETE